MKRVMKVKDIVQTGHQDPKRKREIREIREIMEIMGIMETMKIIKIMKILEIMEFLEIKGLDVDNAWERTAIILVNMEMAIVQDIEMRMRILMKMTQMKMKMIGTQIVKMKKWKMRQQLWLSYLASCYICVFGYPSSAVVVLLADSGFTNSN